MKKLIPALALLLISTVMLSVASYAWFSMNTTVSATNMKVTATTSKNLVIALLDDDGDPIGVYSQAANLTEDTKVLYPTSTADLENWYTTTLSGQAKTDFETGTSTDYDKDDFEKAINTTDGTGNTYYIKNSYNIKVSEVSGGTFDNLYVKQIIVDRAADGYDQYDVTKAIRVGVFVNGKPALFYAPVGGNASYDAIKEVDSTVETKTITTVKTFVEDAIISNLGQVDYEDGVNVDIYVWYEGQDSNCTSAKAISTENLTIDVIFEAAND